MNAKHTATPWYIEPGEKENEVYGINGADNTTVIETDAGFYPPRIEDAKHIVHCVNTHDELIEALETINKLAIGMDTSNLTTKQKNVIALIYINTENILQKEDKFFGITKLEKEV